ncbi:cuticle protein 19-like [Penaeus indicus]|uniref:cuticle protein 19-like n=1 Tax=Penaeus indicus TaxID=29960 RepID=UPI00300C6591
MQFLSCNASHLLQILLVLALMVFASADQRPFYSYDVPQSMEEDSSEEFAPPKYEFQYGVKDGYSGVDFAHGESRDEDETRGSYTVQLPDGRLQKVTYYVDSDDRYVADFIIAGEAQFPESEESREAPAYGYPQ